MSKTGLIGHTPQPAFRDLYPTPSGGKQTTAPREVKPDDIDQNVFTNDKLVYCDKCGFPCRIDRDRREDVGSAAGKGVKLVIDSDLTKDSVYAYLQASNITPDVYDPLVQDGCPCCGTYLYDRKTRHAR